MNGALAWLSNPKNLLKLENAKLKDTQGNNFQINLGTGKGTSVFEVLKTYANIYITKDFQIMNISKYTIQQ